MRRGVSNTPSSKPLRATRKKLNMDDPNTIAGDLLLSMAKKVGAALDGNGVFRQFATWVSAKSRELGPNTLGTETGLPRLRRVAETDILHTIRMSVRPTLVTPTREVVVRPQHYSFWGTVCAATPTPEAVNQLLAQAATTVIGREVTVRESRNGLLAVLEDPATSERLGVWQSDVVMHSLVVAALMCADEDPR